MAGEAPVERDTQGIAPMVLEESVPLPLALEQTEVSSQRAEERVAEVVSEATTVPVQQRTTPPEPAARAEAPYRPEVPGQRRALPTESPTLAVDARAYLGEAGLQLIETDPSKAASTQPEPEPLKLGRARPERRRTVEEELVQVETRSK